MKIQTNVTVAIATFSLTVLPFVRIPPRLQHAFGILGMIERVNRHEPQEDTDRQRTKEPLFQPGVYREHSVVSFGTPWDTEQIYLLMRISDTVGVPLRGEHSDIFSSRMERAEHLTGHRYDDDTDYFRVIRIAQARTIS